MSQFPTLITIYPRRRRPTGSLKATLFFEIDVEFDTWCGAERTAVDAIKTSVESNVPIGDLSKARTELISEVRVNIIELVACSYLLFFSYVRGEREDE